MACAGSRAGAHLLALTDEHRGGLDGRVRTGPGRRLTKTPTRDKARCKGRPAPAGTRTLSAQRWWGRLGFTDIHTRGREPNSYLFVDGVVNPTPR